MRNRLLLLGAAVFALHPIQAEAVNYVWGRGALLGASFCFASLLAWLNGRRWTAMAWFAGAVLLAYECLRRLLPERAALAGAGVFALHPIQAEAVNYVWGRGALLGAAFCFASLLAWLNGRRWTATTRNK